MITHVSITARTDDGRTFVAEYGPAEIVTAEINTAFGVKETPDSGSRGFAEYDYDGTETLTVRVHGKRGQAKWGHSEQGE